MRLRGASRRAPLYFREISIKYGRSGARARYRSRIGLKYSGALLNPKPKSMRKYLAEEKRGEGRWRRREASPRTLPYPPELRSAAPVLTF